jgi:hypothetical protein
MVSDEVIIPMTTLNIFNRMRYLLRFFGIWTFEIVHTLDNMVCIAVDSNGISMNTCTHARRNMYFNFRRSKAKSIFFPLLVVLF